MAQKPRLSSAAALVLAATMAACGNGAGVGDAASDARPGDTGSGGDSNVSETSTGETGAEASIEDVLLVDTATPDGTVEDAQDTGAPDASDGAPVNDEGPRADALDDRERDTGSMGGADALDEEASTGSGGGDGGADTGSTGPMDATRDVASDAPPTMDVVVNMCLPGTTSCGASGDCVNLMNDRLNCGSCGNVCPGGRDCVMGACACASGQTLCGGMCVTTQADNANCGMCGRACPTGQSCSMGTCACPMGGTACGSTCVNTANDEANCGACGRACGMGQSCSMGECQCATGQTRCGTGTTSTCVNTQSDNSNCGACGTACTGGTSCVMGSCVCPAGQMRCGSGATATCVDLQTDNSNCGTCGTACPSGRVCNGGTCTLTCTAPRVACGAGASMSCADTQTDDQNCGACGTVCGTVPNSFGGVCTAGSCRPVCTTGTANCNNMYSDGCEVNTQSDTSNCGTCGTRCPTTAANASGVTCAAGACRPTCDANRGDCNSSVGDGCEIDLQSDPSNCGSCGNVCASGTCFAGQCAARSCRELHTAAPSLPSGVYPIDPDGAGPLPAVNTYCDMVTRGGGWTLVQRSVIDWTMSDMLRTTLEVFRNNTIGNASPGNFYRMAARNWPLIQATNEHMMVHTPVRDDNTSCMPLQYLETGGVWNVPATGNITVTGIASSTFFNNRQAAGISSTDVHNETSPDLARSCVNNHQAAPWFYNYCCSTCPTFGRNYWGWPANPPRPMVSYLGSNDINGRNVTAACAGSASPVQMSSGYYGLSSMEYFIR